jgi:hypothetical protein
MITLYRCIKIELGRIFILAENQKIFHKCAFGSANYFRKQYLYNLPNIFKNQRLMASTIKMAQKETNAPGGYIFPDFSDQIRI